MRNVQKRILIFWLSISISILGWLIYVIYRSLSNKSIIYGIIEGYIVYGAIWLSLFGIIKFLRGGFKNYLKIILIIVVVIQVAMYTIDYAFIRLYSIYSFLYGSFLMLFFDFFLPSLLVCLGGLFLVVDIVQKNIMVNIKELSTRIVLAIFTIFSAIICVLLYYFTIPEVAKPYRILLSIIGGGLVGAHVWVIYGLILYVKAIHKSLINPGSKG